MALAHDLVLPFQLGQAESSFDLPHPVAVADPLEAEPAIQIRLHPLGADGFSIRGNAPFTGAGSAMGHQGTEDFHKVPVTGAHHAPHAGGNGVGHIGAETGNVPEAAHADAVHLGKMSLRAVLNHPQTVLFCNGHDGIHITWHAEGVHRDDALCVL